MASPPPPGDDSTGAAVAAVSIIAVCVAAGFMYYRRAKGDDSDFGARFRKGTPGYVSTRRELLISTALHPQETS